MRSQRWFAVLTVLMVGAIGGCNVFWEGASASSQITQPDAPYEGDTSSDDGAVREDGPDVLTGDSAPPVDRGPDANPPQDRVETDTLTDVLDTDVAGEDVVFVDVGDEGMVSIDVPLTGDVVDAGTAPDVSEDVAPPPDVTSPVDTTPSPDVVVMVDVGQDAGVPDVGFDATSVATDGGDAGPSDTGIDTGPACPTGQTLCGGSCVNTATSADHCGACSINCPVPVFPNMVRACQSGQCGAVCVTGFANCDGLMGNGCEVDTRVTTQHCGACSRSCSLANATPTCLGGSCYITSCATGFANCDNNETNGCEADTRSNVQHCGGCGRTCGSMLNGTTSCMNSECVSRCNDGYVFDDQGRCALSDLVVEYVAQLHAWYTVPRYVIRLTESAYGIRVAFSGDGYRLRACDTVPVPFMRDGRQWWRCSIRSVAVSDAGAANLLLSVDSPCGFASGLSCPDRWNEQWRVILRGRVYESPRDASRFVQYDACPYGGWSAGCVHLRLTP